MATVQSLLGRGYPKEYETVDVDSFKQTYDVAFAEDVLQRMGHRFPGLERAEIERAAAVASGADFGTERHGFGSALNGDIMEC